MKYRCLEGDGVRVEFTAMIDVVFLLLIFFMLIPIKEMEAKLETQLSGKKMDSIDSEPTDPKVVFHVELSSAQVNEDVVTRVSVNSREVAQMNSPSLRKIGDLEEKGGKAWRNFLEIQLKRDEVQASPSSPNFLAVSKAIRKAVVGSPEGLETQVVISSGPGVPFKWVMAVFNAGLDVGLENLRLGAADEAIWTPDVL
jgi:biopolymer transport protein ExbD